MVVKFTNEELLDIAAALFAATYTFDRRSSFLESEFEESAIELIHQWREILTKIEDELDIPITKMTRGKLWS